MSAELKPGQRGWIAYVDAYPLEVEFLGHGPDYADYPALPTKYWRALSDMLDWNYQHVYAGNVVDSTESESDETILHATREGAIREVLASAQAWEKREHTDDAEKRGRLDRLRAELGETVA